MKKEKIILIGITLIAILLGLKPITPKAATVDYTYKKYRVRYYSLATGDEALTSVTEMGTATTLSSGYGVNMVSARFGTTSKFQAGTTYKVTIDVGFGGLEDEFLYLDNHACFGSSTINSWDADSSKISTCEYVGSTMNNNNRINYVFNITPRANVEGIQFNLYYGVTEEVRAVNVRPTSTVTYGEDPTGAINEQTIKMQEEFENISNIINENNQNLINSITEQNQVCEEISFVYNSSDLETGQILSNGNVGTDTSMKHTDYIEINQRSETFNEGNWPNAQTGEFFCIYDKYKTKTRCYSYNTYYSNNKFLFNQFNENEKYIRLTLWNNSNNRGTIYVKTCKNGNQALIDADHNYTENEGQEIQDYENTQENIDQNIDLDTTNKINIALDTNSNNFIWMVFDSLKNINNKIILFFNSIMALGIIKIILGR